VDALTVVGLVSNIVSFIESGSKFVKALREIRNSTSGATGDALSHGLIAGEMRKFANELVQSGQAVNKKDKAICDLAKECKSVGKDILKLVERSSQKGSVRVPERPQCDQRSKDCTQLYHKVRV
jgi:hypothetical protein